jgi:hypothetical protein
LMTASAVTATPVFDSSEKQSADAILDTSLTSQACNAFHRGLQLTNRVTPGSECNPNRR